MNNTNSKLNGEVLGKILDAFSSDSNNNNNNDNNQDNSGQFSRNPKNSKLATVSELAFMCANTSELISEMKKLESYNSKLTNSITLINKIVLALVQENKTLRVNSNKADSVAMRTLDEYMSAADNMYTEIIRSRLDLDPSYVNGSILNISSTSTPNVSTNTNNGMNFDDAVEKITGILQHLSNSDEVIHTIKESK